VVTAEPKLLPSTLNCTLSVLEETLVETVMFPVTVAPETGEVIEMVGGRLLTLIEEDALVVVLPDELVAIAVREKVPSDNLLVSSEKSKGALVTAAPTLFPSTMNCTLVVLEETLVVIGTVPETVAPEVGEVIETLGAPALATVMETGELRVDWPDASMASAVSRWVPSDNFVESREYSNGALVTVGPELFPSTLNCTLMVFVETLVMTVTAPDTVVPWDGAVIEIVGGVVADKLPFFEPALVSPTHPLQSSDRRMMIRQ